MNQERKISRSIKIFPFFEGISNDLLFFISIETLLFRDVKAFSSVQINIIYFAGVASVLLVQGLCKKIVNRIGNVASARLGALMLIVAASMFTFCKSFVLVLIGQIIYINAFSFKSMSGIVLANNLKSVNRFDEYVDLQNRAALIYAVATFAISLCSGVLYNISYLLVMGLCILTTIISFILSFFLYDPSIIEVKQEKQNASFPKSVQTCILLYGLIYGIITVGQANSNLFIEEVMNDQYSVHTKVLLFSLVMSGGGFLRIVYNYFYPRLYHKLQYKVLSLLSVLYALSFLFVLAGYYLPARHSRIVLMALGYYLFFCVRDSFDSTMRKLTLSKCDEKDYTSAFFSLIQCRKGCEAMLDIVASAVLSFSSYPLLMVILLVLESIHAFNMIRFISHSGSKTK